MKSPEQSQPEKRTLSAVELMYFVERAVLQNKYMRQHRSYSTPALMPFYDELTQILGERRGFAETGAHGLTFKYTFSDPYGRTSSGEPGMYMYQRLLAYSAHKGRKSQLLGVVHAIDPGDAKGPGTTTDATLNAGILQTSNPNNLVYFNRIANIEPGVLEPQEFMPVLNGFVAPELVELDETHTKETAVPFKDRPNVSAVLKAANTARQLGAIVFNGDQNRRV